MMRRGSLASIFILVAAIQELCLGQYHEVKFSRDDFPPDFMFGAGTSAYQWEGAAAEDGRSPSIWDTSTHEGRVQDKSTGDVASDGYHKYKGDVKLIADSGMNSFKFSISWSRLIPKGRGAVNPKGLDFYNNLIDELLSYGIKPHVTLYHLDLPQVLEDEYVGWQSSSIVEDFTAYADVCFREFGDRVKQWTTIAEPNVHGIASYDQGKFPPNRCSYPFGFNCTAGDSTTEPYIAVHNMLLAHASVGTLYKTKYQAIQNGWIGLNVYSFWAYPFSNSSRDIGAAQRMTDFVIGWILHPLVFGDYPPVMKKIVLKRLPSFNKVQAEQIMRSFDFIGLNHYKCVYVKDNSNVSKTGPHDYIADHSVLITDLKDEEPTSAEFPSRPTPFNLSGLQDIFHSQQQILEYVKGVYKNPPIFIEESGYGLGANNTINDTERIHIISGFMSSILDAIRDGANVRGYYVWSLVDVFEFLGGHQVNFGLYYVDFEDDDRPRQPKFSAIWYSKFLKEKGEKRFHGLNSLHENSHSQADA